MLDNRERIRCPSKDGREFLTSPRQVLRRLVQLSEGRQFLEAARIVRLLGSAVLRSVMAELPIDLLLEHLPHSVHLLESYYVRLLYVDPEINPNVRTEAVMWQMVRLFSSPHDNNLKQHSCKLIQCLAEYDPNVLNLIKESRQSFDMAVRGLGEHGLMNHLNGQLVSLHVALQTELQRHVDTYKAALHKLEELNMITTKQDLAHSSHQRLLAINYADIQQRLIDNKIVLTILDKPGLSQLPALIEQLNQRVNNDKEVLKCVGQVKRVDPQVNWEKPPAASLLMNFARACQIILDIITHTDNRTTLPAATIPPTQLIKSDTFYGSSASFSDGYHSDDSAKEELGGMISQYRNLYIRNRTETLEALDSMAQLKHVHSLKAKILFSIVVLSFRLCHGMRERKVLEVRRVLKCPLDSASQVSLALDRAARHYLYETSETFPLGEIERTVFSQVLSTLHEYPCLHTCPPLTHFVSACVRLSWAMINQQIPYYLDNDFNLGFLRPEKHERHAQADRRSDLIKHFLWPALMQNNHCVVKATVAT